MVHVEAYLLLVDNYIPDLEERRAAFSAYQEVPSVKLKADFCFKYMDAIQKIERIETCIEGLFFFGSFAYVYFLRSRGLLPGLASATNWIFRDESMHIVGAMEVIKSLRVEYPECFDKDMHSRVLNMLDEAIEVEMNFCEDCLHDGVTGMSPKAMREYLMYCADQRLVQMGYEKKFKANNPFPFMVLQDVQPLTNFFEKRVTEYQKGFKSSDSSISFEEQF
ncbi:hypothetical protein CHS0354_000588 [Potamilus streckersoni]|uniref:Uncharacterized protein n=1 Tax=Potamilus streckersoni TaxID=2493646 RepID=A0AAE0T7V9_9BIVA|nr:hypothetical protein CHS0354_000588 [Potamilus streckersoni]